MSTVTDLCQQRLRPPPERQRYRVSETWPIETSHYNTRVTRCISFFKDNTVNWIEDGGAVDLFHIRSHCVEIVFPSEMWALHWILQLCRHWGKVMLLDLTRGTGGIHDRNASTVLGLGTRNVSPIGWEILNCQ